MFDAPPTWVVSSGVAKTFFEQVEMMNALNACETHDICLSLIPETLVGAMG